MALVVYDYGVRTLTPWYDIFPARDVNRLNELAAGNKLSEHDQVRESAQPAQDSSHRHEQAAVKHYQSEQDQTSRQQVFYARDVMSSPVITLPETAILQTAWHLFQQHGVRHIPVVNETGRLCGLVSQTDLLWASSRLATDTPIGAHKTVADVMSRWVLTVGPITEIRELAAVMTGHRIGAVPVLDSEETIVGIVTRGDILQAVMHRAPIDLWS